MKGRGCDGTFSGVVVSTVGDLLEVVLAEEFALVLRVITERERHVAVRTLEARRMNGCGGLHRLIGVHRFAAHDTLRPSLRFHSLFLFRWEMVSAVVEVVPRTTHSWFVASGVFAVLVDSRTHCWRCIHAQLSAALLAKQPHSLLVALGARLLVGSRGCAAFHRRRTTGVIKVCVKGLVFTTLRMRVTGSHIGRFSARR